MAPTTKVFSLEGKALKLDTAAQAECHMGPLRDMKDVEEIRLQGNTIVSTNVSTLADLYANFYRASRLLPL